MGVANYTVIDGELVSENRDGVEHDYVPDPLGSTVALLDNTQAQTDTFTYWPYGEERTRTGTTATPFRYVGAWGAYRDSATLCHIRGRELSVNLGRWKTIDWLEQGVLQYVYALDSPVSWIDIYGLFAQKAGPQVDKQFGKGGCPGKDTIDWIIKYLADKAHRECLKAIKERFGGTFPGVLQGIPVKVDPNDQCNPNSPGGSSCHWNMDDKGKCVPKDICFNKSACKGSPKQKACLLLCELGNWFECKKIGPPTDEEWCKEIVKRCGLSSVCGGGGLN